MTINSCRILFYREHGWYSHMGVHPLVSVQLHYERQLTQLFPPNCSVQNVDKPFGYLRKFTPDGNLLLSFSVDQRSLDVFKYLGIAKTFDLMNGVQSEYICADDATPLSSEIRQKIFERILTKLYTITLIGYDVVPTPILRREFSVFFHDGRFVLLASMSITVPRDAYEDQLIYSDLWDAADKFNYKFYLVDLKLGVISDTLCLNDESISLPHNFGVSTFGNIIAMLSMHYQCVHLIELTSDGKMCPIYKVGPFGSQFDQHLFQSTCEHWNTVYIIRDHLPLSHLKQKILSFMYKRSVARGDVNGFYKTYHLFELMLISKMQLLDEDHIFLRYENRPPASEQESQRKISDFISTIFPIYVVYCISQQKVLKIFEKTSTDLLYMLRDFCDDFRNVRSLQDHRSSSSPSNNEHSRSAFNTTISTMLGGVDHAALLFNSTLPISSQSFSTNPYLDYSLYEYDDQEISAFERPKISVLQPLSFVDRITRITKFRLYLNNSVHRVSDSARSDLILYIFHPFEPFLISVIKLRTDYMINFHLYNTSTIVRP